MLIVQLCVDVSILHLYDSVFCNRKNKRLAGTSELQSRIRRQSVPLPRLCTVGLQQELLTQNLCESLASTARRSVGHRQHHAASYKLTMLFIDLWHSMIHRSCTCHSTVQRLKPPVITPHSKQPPVITQTLLKLCPVYKNNSFCIVLCKWL